MAVQECRDIDEVNSPCIRVYLATVTATVDVAIWLEFNVILPLSACLTHWPVTCRPEAELELQANRLAYRCYQTGCRSTGELEFSSRVSAWAGKVHHWGYVATCHVTRA